MWAIIVNEKIVEIFEEYEEALDKLFDLFLNGVSDANIKKLQKVLDN